MAADIQSFNTANPGNGSSVTVTKPTGLEVGDLMIFHYGFNDATDTASTISGWTHEVNNQTAGTFKTGLQWKIAEASDVAAANFTLSLSGAVVNPIGAIIRITGFSATGLLNDAGAVSTNNSTATFTNSVTPATANSLMLFFAGNNEAQATSNYAIATDNPTWSEVYDVTGGGLVAISLAKATRSQTTATGNSSCTLVSGSTVDAYGIMVAIGSSISVSVTGSTGVLTLAGNVGTVSAGANVTGSTGDLTLAGNAGTVTTPEPEWTNTSKSSAPSWSNITKS